MTKRAELMLKEAEKIKCRVFLTASGVTKGTYNLNLAFVAYLFNRYPALQMPSGDVQVVDETREEKSAYFQRTCYSHRLNIERRSA